MLATKGRYPRLHGGGGRAERAASQLQLELADLAVTTDRPDQLEQLVRQQALLPDQAEGVGGRAGPDHPVLGVEDHGRAAQQGQHVGGAGRQQLGGDLVVGDLLLALADPERERSGGADEQADDGREPDEQRLHPLIVGGTLDRSRSSRPSGRGFGSCSPSGRRRFTPGWQAAAR